ncbi:hypothetical protein JTB14_008709 [Gonioctena quinquepunctata]|nr:hypothetical protein JTB14_008709 [Gonioctena quinquepunctata]
MEAYPPNLHRQVANVTSYVIKVADNHTKQLQQLNNITDIFGEKPEIIETWESDYEKAKTTNESAIKTLLNAVNETIAIPTANFDEATNEEVPMETNQIAVRVTTPEKYQQNSDMEQIRETLEMDKQPKLGRKLNIQIPADEDRIARRILEEKLKVDKAAAERAAYFNKKKDERDQFKERTRKLKKRKKSDELQNTEAIETVRKKGTTVLQIQSGTERPIQSTQQPPITEEYSSHFHVEEQLNKIQLEIAEKAGQVTELHLNRDITFNVNIEEINAEPIREFMREEIYNQRIE